MLRHASKACVSCSEMNVENENMIEFCCIVSDCICRLIRLKKLYRSDRTFKSQVFCRHEESKSKSKKLFWSCKVLNRDQ
jgi:hypothetical protein